MTQVKLKFEYDGVRYNLTAKMLGPCELKQWTDKNENYWDVMDMEDHWILTYATDKFIFEAQFELNSYKPLQKELVVWSNENVDAPILDYVKVEIIIR